MPQCAHLMYLRNLLIIRIVLELLGAGSSSVKVFAMRLCVQRRSRSSLKAKAVLVLQGAGSVVVRVSTIALRV